MHNRFIPSFEEGRPLRFKSITLPPEIGAAGRSVVTVSFKEFLTGFPAQYRDKYFRLLKMHGERTCSVGVAILLTQSDYS